MDFDLIHNLSIGFGVALSLQNLMYCFSACCWGR